jgi:hypothetical protein
MRQLPRGLVVKRDQRLSWSFQGADLLPAAGLDRHALRSKDRGKVRCPEVSHKDALVTKVGFEFDPPEQTRSAVPASIIRDAKEADVISRVRAGALTVDVYDL